MKKSQQNNPFQTTMLHWQGWYSKNLKSLQIKENMLAKVNGTKPHKLVLNSLGCVVSSTI